MGSLALGEACGRGWLTYGLRQLRRRQTPFFLLAGTHTAAAGFTMLDEVDGGGSGSGTKHTYRCTKNEDRGDQSSGVPSCGSIALRSGIKLFSSSRAAREGEEKSDSARTHQIKESLMVLDGMGRVRMRNCRWMKKGWMEWCGWEGGFQYSDLILWSVASPHHLRPGSG